MGGVFGRFLSQGLVLVRVGILLVEDIEFDVHPDSLAETLFHLVVDPYHRSSSRTKVPLALVVVGLARDLEIRKRSGMQVDSATGVRIAKRVTSQESEGLESPESNFPSKQPAGEPVGLRLRAGGDVLVRLVPHAYGRPPKLQRDRVLRGTMIV